MKENIKVIPMTDQECPIVDRYKDGIDLAVVILCMLIAFITINISIFLQYNTFYLSSSLFIGTGIIFIIVVKRWG